MDQSLEDRTLGPRTLDGWLPPPRPSGALEGSRVRLEPLTLDHAEGLHAANGEDAEGRMWLYMAYGPFTLDSYRTWVANAASRADPFFYAIIDRQRGQPTGVASYLRIDPPAGSIEVGHIALSPLLQRTPMATEAMFLMMQWAFQAGYRRYEWKCHAGNAASRRAAQRLGLSYEGVFRQATVSRGRNRDTAWYAAIDGEWPALRAAFQTWLAPDNFDADGRQQQSLGDLTRPLLVSAS